MWMMGYGEAEDMNMQVESYASRKLRPLVPRPSCFRSDHLLHHVGNGEQQQHKREFNSQSQQMVVVSSRWNPTPEQLQTLEELYRRGTRTPSADEIQHITAQLRRYGKIEGKNVFYWFQNHKARERQKRRRQLHQPPPDITLDGKHSEVNRTSNEVEETRNWAIPTFSEKIGLTTKAESRVTSIADQGWINVEHQEEGNDELLLLHRRWKSLSERNVMWTNMMQCLSSSAPPTNHCIPVVAPSATKTLSSLVVSPCFRLDVDSYQTLELFPVTNSGHELEEPEKCFLPTTDINPSPRQFIEFLPLKN